MNPIAYLFRIATVTFIIKCSYSSIGNGYSNIFFNCGDGTYVNLDCYLGAFFGMSQSDWDSWFDDDLIRDADFDEVASKYNLDVEAINNICEYIMNEQRTAGIIS